MRQILIFFLTICYYITLPVLVSGVIAINATLTSNGGINGEIVCTPNNRELSQVFVERMWTKAREELGLSDEIGRLTGIIANSTTSSMSMSRNTNAVSNEALGEKQVKAKIENIRGNINNFYNNSASAAIYFPPNNKQPIVYARIWKCANELITRNLGQFDDYVRKEVAEDLPALNKIFIDDRSAVPKVFTFVRDPLERFCSGFTEAVYRDMRTKSQVDVRQQQQQQQKQQQQQQQQQKKQNELPSTVDKDRVKVIIRDIVDLTFPPPIQYLNHIYPMSATFFAFPVDILGHLEHLEQDWETIVVPAYYITQQFNPALSASIHATSANHPHIKDKDKELYNSHDPNNARTILRELLRDEPHYKRAICALLLIDYVCLPEYKLPSECMHLKDERHAMETTLRNSITSSLKE